MPPQTATIRRSTPQRSRLSDLTNRTQGPGAGERQIAKPQHQDENCAVKGCSDQCRTEIAKLRKQLAEKEKIIEDQKAKMDKIWNNYCLKTKQNQDVIKQNGQLFKEWMYARDKMKLLEHENAQMAAVHKMLKSELQIQLKQSNDMCQGNTTQMALENPEKAKQTLFPSILVKLAESRARRTGDVLDGSLENKETSKTSKTTLRRRDSLSYREPSLKTKLRQPEDSSKQSKFHSRQVRGLHKLMEEQDSEDADDVQAPKDGLDEDEQQLNQDNVNMDSYDVSSQHRENGISAQRMAKPCRRSVGSISSYREAPLNIKMRRAD